MAAPIRQKGSISKPSGVLSSDPFDFSLSLPPDSGIGLRATEWTGEQGATHRKQGTVPPMLSIRLQWKRRVEGWMGTDSDLEADFTLEAPHGGLPRRGGGALFGLSCCGSESMTNEAAEAQEGSPADDGTPEWTRSPGVVLTDSVMHLQREIKELRSDYLYNHTATLTADHIYVN